MKVNVIQLLGAAPKKTKKKKPKIFKVKVKHPGVLEVPQGKKVWQLPFKHAVKLAKTKGRGPIVRALNNLLIWNKNKKTESAMKIKKWATGAKLAVNRYFEKMAANVIANFVVQAGSDTAKSAVKDFFGAYSSVAREVKKIKSMKGKELESALGALNKATMALKALFDRLG